MCKWFRLLAILLSDRRRHMWYLWEIWIMDLMKTIIWSSPRCHNIFHIYLSSKSDFSKFKTTVSKIPALFIHKRDLRLCTIWTYIMNLRIKKTLHDIQLYCYDSVNISTAFCKQAPKHIFLIQLEINYLLTTFCQTAMLYFHGMSNKYGNNISIFINSITLTEH